MGYNELSMARARKTKPTLDSLFFVTPEQKLLRLLLTYPTTTFTPRNLSSKLKGVRGLGGAEGIKKILDELAEIGLVQFLNNNRSVALENDHTAARLYKTFSAVCDLEGLSDQLQEISTKGILFGSRSTGDNQTESDYDLFVVTDQCEEVRKLAGCHPLGKKIEVVCCTPTDYLEIDQKDPELEKKLARGVILWGSIW
jgi:predicted nucleotidyltransferase